MTVTFLPTESMHTMALGLFLVFLPLLLFSCAGAAAASAVGMCYGRVANDLPDPKSVVQLLKQNNITMVRIFDSDPGVLTALANTGIKVMVALPSTAGDNNLTMAAADPSFALAWVRANVAAHYPATKIHAVAVGNEVIHLRPELTPHLVAAMANVHRALQQLGLAGGIKVTSPVAFDALKHPTFPPSAGRFRDDLAEAVMRPMLDFLQRTGSYLTINIYPFWAYVLDQQDVSRDYALGTPSAAAGGVRDDGTGLVYHNLMDAERDVVHAAMDALGFPGVASHVTETGYPWGGRSFVANASVARDGGRWAFSVANAREYNDNLIRRVLAGDTGTPLRPDADMDVYIFALFNENQKGTGGSDDIEQHFGLFDPTTMRKVYDFDFVVHGGGGGGGASWCVANATAGDERLQVALEYACGHGADCSDIQRGGACFEPDTKAAHASHAFNSYYQRKHRATGACDFAGAAYVVDKQPRIGDCVLPSGA